MPKQLILEVRYSAGEMERYRPVPHPTVPLAQQAERLRKFLFDALERGGVFSVEVFREDGEPSRRIFVVEKISGLDVCVTDRKPAAAATGAVSPDRCSTGLTFTVTSRDRRMSTWFAEW